MDKTIIEKLIKENIIYILIPILLFAVGCYFSYVKISEAVKNYNELVEKKQDIKTKEARLETLEAAKAKQSQETESKKEARSGKVIYEVLDQQFSPEASFGIMFENVLSNIANSGLRVRSIDYNYSPQEDKILQTNMPGYNSCELSFTAVGTYSQLQTFFKNIVKENYLTNIHEIYIEPYDKDKTILISKFKVRLYTKTVRG